MNWYKIFYWFSIVENISNFALAIAIIFSIIAVVSWLVKVFCDEDYDKNILKKAMPIFKWSLPFAIAGWLIFTFIPTKKQILMIIAGGSVGNFIQGDSSVQKLPADVTRYLHLSMKKEIESLSSETKEELGIATAKDKLLNKAKEMTKEELIEFIKTDSTIVK